jgi:signal transduction histidine kinase
MESSSHHFFSFFDPLVGDELRKGVTICTVAAQGIIFDEEDQSDCLYLVLSGKVELCKRAGERTYLAIALVGENDFFGELGVLDGSVRGTRAVAVEETTLARVDRKPILGALRNTSGKTVIDLFNRTIQHIRLTDERYVAAIVRKEKLTLLSEMAGSIIHDLRNPCHGILMASMLVQKLHSDNKTERCCDIIQNQVNRMVSTLDELLEFSRGTYPLTRETMSVAVLMEKFAALNRDYMKQNNIELELPLADVFIHADCSRLLRVLQCLVFTAGDALKENNGQVTISGRRLDGAVEICVRDNGPGISDAVRDMIFEPFVTPDRNGGGGLGLAICKSIVEAHGGRIFCESKQGGGTAFFVQLPLP